MALGRKRQSRLQLSPLPSSSPSKKEHPRPVQDRLANVRLSNTMGQSPVHTRKARTNCIPTPEPSSQIDQDSLHGNPAPPSQEGDSEEILPSASKRRKPSTAQPDCFPETPRRLTRRHRKTDRDLRDTPPTSASCAAQQLRSTTIPGQAATPVTTQVRADLSPLRTGTGPWNLGSPETSEDEADVLSSKPIFRHGGRKRLPSRKDTFVVSDDADTVPSLTDDDHAVAPFSRRKPEVINQTPRSRRLKSRREDQELKEDLEDLQDSGPPQLQISRTRGAPVNKERERRREYIELLKRRRAGGEKPVRRDSSEDQEPDQVESAAHQPEDIFSNFIGSPVEGHTDGPSSEDDGAIPNPDLDVSEEDFVVFDERDEEQQANDLSRPHPDIPIEFTSYASASPRELFIFVIDWLVKNKIAPAFSRHDALWKLAFSKVKAEMTAQAGSRLRSSAWTGPFTTVLNARPKLEISRLDLDDSEKRGCDACNRRNHPAQYNFVFSGPAYHHDTLEPVDQDSTSEAEDSTTKSTHNNDDNISVDSQGRSIPPTTTHFHLGRYCANNAELAHKFGHWKFSLNDELVNYLESQGVLSADEIVRRERARGGQKKREREAEELVDRMQAQGIVEQLWRGLRSDLDDARMGMDGYERRGGRGNRRVGSVRAMLAGGDDML